MAFLGRHFTQVVFNFTEFRGLEEFINFIIFRPLFVIFLVSFRAEIFFTKAIFVIAM